MALILAINWTNALIVTLLGFSLVFCLLVLLVFVLKLFGVIMTPREKKKKKVLDEPTLENIPQSMVSGGLTDQEQAAVALALQMFYDEGCKEKGKLTLKAIPTAWNAKIYGINNLDK